MTINLDIEQTTLEAQAEDFLRVEGVYERCHVAILLDSVRRYRQELQSQGVESRNYRLAVKHADQFENMLRRELEASKEDMKFFRNNASAIRDALAAGEDFTYTDWGNGWNWQAQVIRVDGVLIQIRDEGLGLYYGQNGKSLIKKDFLSSLG